MPSRRAVLLGLAASALAGHASAQQRIKVVASFSILADLVKNVGGERTEVASLVGPGGNIHVYSPTPADARTLAAAAVIVVNGLGLEGWMTRLVASSGTKAATVVASRGVAARRMPDEDHAGRMVTDPHAWQSVANAKIYVANIRDGLKRADPPGAGVYDQNASGYLKRLDALEREVRAAIDRIPPERRKVITNHDAFGYFAAEYGVQFVAAEGVSADAEPSAKSLARIIAQIRRQRIPAVFMENISDPRLMQTIARETAVKIGGTLYSDALSPATGPAASYIDLIRSNVREISAALMP